MENPISADFWKIKLEKPAFFTLVIYLSLVALIEIFGQTTDPISGAIGNALLIFVAVNLAVRMHNEACYRILPAIALIPFLRLLSVVVPVPGWALQIDYILIAIPLLVTVGLLAYYRNISLTEFGLQRAAWRTQLPIALSGLPLGFVGFLLLRPAPLFAGQSLILWIANLLVVLICIAFTEELIFRGVLLHLIAEVSERFALLISGIFYGILYIGSQSLIYALLMGLVGLLFAYFVLRTRSIWGVVVAHFLLVAGMVLFWPPLF